MGVTPPKRTLELSCHLIKPTWCCAQHPNNPSCGRYLGSVDRKRTSVDFLDVELEEVERWVGKRTVECRNQRCDTEESYEKRRRGAGRYWWRNQVERGKRSSILSEMSWTACDMSSADCYLQEIAVERALWRKNSTRCLRWKNFHDRRHKTVLAAKRMRIALLPV